MNPEPSSVPDLPLDELAIVPAWIRAPAKSFEHHSGEDKPAHRRGRDRDRNRDRKPDRPPRERPPHDGPSRDRPPHDRPPRERPPHDRPPRRDKPRPGQQTSQSVEDQKPVPRTRPGPSSDHPQFERKHRRHGVPPHRGAGGSRPADESVILENLEVGFVPDEKVFDAMAETMKQTGRAYAMFDVAKLVLNKPERHHVVLKRKTAKDGSQPLLWRVTWDDNLFVSQEEALQHVIRRYADRLYKETQTTVEPPKGNFTFVNRCGLSGVWLGPPNFHEYQSRLMRHYQEHFPHMPFERFRSRIETVKDPEAVKAWLDSVSVKRQFECQLCAENKPVFDSLADLKKHFVEQHAAGCIESAPQFTLSGPVSRQLSDRPIMTTIRVAWETERRFPLNTVAALRPVLRKHSFAYFKDDRNVTYITRIRRKRFESLDGLADNIRNIVMFLRANPNSSRKQLVEHFLGPQPPPPPTPPETSTPVPSVEATAVAETPAASTSSDSPDQAATATPVPEPAPASAPAEPAAVLHDLTPEEKTLADLHWLITDGYVVEFSDGRLMAWPDAPPKPTTPAEAAATESAVAAPVTELSSEPPAEPAANPAPDITQPPAGDSPPEPPAPPAKNNPN